MAGMPASGDPEIIQALFVHRVLESGQLARITGRSSPVIRRRLAGYLSEQGLIHILQGTAVDQRAYTLSPKGMDQVAGHLGLDPKYLPFSRHPPSGPASPFYRHMRLANNIAIAFRLACQEVACPVELYQTIFEWEMVSDLRARRSKKPWEKFKICEALPELHDSNQLQILRPDLVLCLRPCSAPASIVAAYVEADRATMSVQGALMRKLRPYWLMFLRQGFTRYGAAAMRVLFVFANISTDQRLQSFWQTLERFCQQQAPEHEQFNQARARLARSLGHPPRPQRDIEDFARCFRLARWDQLRQHNILIDPLWHDSAGRRVGFFRGAPESLPQSQGLNETREQATSEPRDHGPDEALEEAPNESLEEPPLPAEASSPPTVFSTPPPSP